MAITLFYFFLDSLFTFPISGGTKPGLKAENGKEHRLTVDQVGSFEFEARENTSITGIT